jgi:hypothetical protein
VLATADKLATSSAWQIAPLDKLGHLISAAPQPDWLPGTCHYSRA